MKRLRLFWGICKRCHLDKFVIMFFICYFVSAGVIYAFEPGIETYRDGMWYLFVACTSIGFGDVVVTTTIGKLLTAFITVYEIVLVAMVSGVVVSHYLEVVNAKEKETATIFIDKLEHLSELSRDELFEIQERVKATLSDRKSKDKH